MEQGRGRGNEIDSCYQYISQVKGWVNSEFGQKVIINQKKVYELLGVPKYKHAKGENKNEVGVTCGLAWTQVGVSC